jgi:hypothetical protein
VVEEGRRCQYLFIHLLPCSCVGEMRLKSGLWIRIHFLQIRIRIQSLMLEANTDTDPDPNPDPDPIRIQGPSNTSKHELLQTIVYFCGSFLPSWIRIRIRIPNTDPDPQTQLNTDPIRIRIRIRIHNPG